ncbi:family A G protein-coupled receptor-like protein [Neoconidiobolus thromboides FSU 785]|nr:family A G protein-coupled receptor-like protein [Neoconidiobolus thromboides FSU 785]
MDEGADKAVNIALAVIIFLSLLFNTLLLILLIKKRKQDIWTLNDKLIVGVATIDIVEGIFGISSSIYHTSYGDTLLYDKPWYCQISGYIMTTLLLNSILLLVLISIYRYRILSKKAGQYNLRYLYIILGLIGIIHFFGLLCLGFSNFYPVGSGAYCYPSLHLETPGIIYYTVIAIINFLAPLAFGFSYLGIYFTFRKFTKKEHIELNDSNNVSYKNGKPITSISNMSNDISNKILFRTIIYLFLYLPIWFPNLVSIGWDLTHLNEAKRPLILDVLSVIGVLLTILINPVMVFLLRSSLVYSLLELLRIRRNRL